MSSAQKKTDSGSLFRLPAGLEQPAAEAQCVVKFCGLGLSASGELLARAFAWLSEGERVRALRFHRQVDHERFVLGRGFIRALGAEHLSIEPGAVEVMETSSGKPFLAGEGLAFNVSHSGNCVLIAWSAGQPVGADVEADRALEEATLTGIAAVSFSSEERAALAVAAGPEKAPVFHRIWVRKEAIIKAEGVGLGGPLQGFSVGHIHGGEVVWADCVPYPGSDRIWRLVDLESPPGCYAALAIPPAAVVCEGRNVLLDWQP